MDKRRVRVLMLTPPAHLRTPMPRITAQLVVMLESIGCEVATEIWGRHSEHETLREKLLGRIDDIRRIRRQVDRTRPDLMMVQTSHDWKTLVRDVLLLVATRSRRVPTVLQLHGSQPETLLRGGNTLFKLVSGWVVRMSDAVLVLSSDEQEKWRRFLPTGKFYVVTNPFVGRAAAASNPGHEPQWRRSVPPGTPILLFVGRLMKEKGVFDLLEVLSQLKGATHAHLLMVGDGEAREEIHHHIRRLDLAQQVTLTGYLEPDELQATYEAATIFVLPTWWFEGFPTVIAEAMHAGLPIVTTPIRGTIDHLQDEVNALFVPPHNPAAVAEAVLRLLRDRPLAHRMAAANRHDSAKFAPNVVVAGYQHVLNDILG
jgi:glycosyltransferase involved in cell wall biosynthesis